MLRVTKDLFKVTKNGQSFFIERPKSKNGTFSLFLMRTATSFAQRVRMAAAILFSDHNSIRVRFELTDETFEFLNQWVQEIKKETKITERFTIM